MSYDDWKADEPEPVSECDACGLRNCPLIGSLCSVCWLKEVNGTNDDPSESPEPE
jgi:hypothetical protein